MLNELDILKDVCTRLEKARIQYMLTGSMAMNYYAQPRMTRTEGRPSMAASSASSSAGWWKK